MTIAYPYTEAFRRDVLARCSSFERRDGDAGGLKRAAVGIVLTESDENAGDTAFLLTLRSPTLRSHGGQFALPGGRTDPEETAVEAVIREVEEELGLALDQRDVLGVLDDYPTRSGYVITPVVAWAGRDRAITPNSEEVARVHRIALRQITAPGAVHFVNIPESERPVIRIRVNDVFLHAPAAALLYQFSELLAGRVTRVDGLEQPVFAWR